MRAAASQGDHKGACEWLAENIVECEDDRNFLTAHIFTGAFVAGLAWLLCANYAANNSYLISTFGPVGSQRLAEIATLIFPAGLLVAIRGIPLWCIVTFSLINRLWNWGNGWVGARYLKDAIKKLRRGG